MDLMALHESEGAVLAADHIPLHYGDLKAEFEAGLQGAVLMDRSHEGRITLDGRDRFDLPHRISTNDLLNMTEGEGRPTIFTNPNGRILDRVMAYHRGDSLLMLAETGRGTPLLHYLQRNVFFNDHVKLRDLSGETRAFALHGPMADTIMGQLIPDSVSLPALHSRETLIAETAVFIARRKPISGTYWALVVPSDRAADVWAAVTEVGQAHGLQHAGSLTYNTLRIQAGRPAAGRELSPDFIPLEIGLWDEISFTKGCYTGQEIIARMESRNRLAKIMVRLELAAFVEAPAAITLEGKPIGTLTSSAVSPHDDVFAIGVLKPQYARAGQQVTVGDHKTAAVIEVAGTQPAQVLTDEISET